MLRNRHADDFATDDPSHFQVAAALMDLDETTSPKNVSDLAS